MPVNALAALSSSFKKNVRFRRDLGVGSNFFDSPGYCCCSYMTGMLLRIQESMNSYLKLPKQSATLWWHNHRKSSFYRHPSKGCTHYCLPLSTPAKMCSKSTGQKTKTAISLGEFLVIVTILVQPCLCCQKKSARFWVQVVYDVKTKSGGVKITSASLRTLSFWDKKYFFFHFSDMEINLKPILFHDIQDSKRPRKWKQKRHSHNILRGFECRDPRTSTLGDGPVILNPAMLELLSTDNDLVFILQVIALACWNYFLNCHESA